MDSAEDEEEGEEAEDVVCCFHEAEVVGTGWAVWVWAAGAVVECWPMGVVKRGRERQVCVEFVGEEVAVVLDGLGDEKGDDVVEG